MWQSPGKLIPKRQKLLILRGYWYWFLALGTLLAACNTHEIEYEVIPLHHNLGELRIRKSVYFDTLSVWTHELDCDCCHMRKARLSNTQFPLILENGWKYPQPDSALQLTVIQSEKAGCDTSFQVNGKEMQIQYKYVANLYGDAPEWVYNKFETISGYRFIVLGWEIPHYGRYSGQNHQRLLAITSIDGERVTLDFFCQRGDCGNFLRRSHWLLEHMKIVR